MLVFIFIDKTDFYRDFQIYVSEQRNLLMLKGFYKLSEFFNLFYGDIGYSVLIHVDESKLASSEIILN